MKKITYNFEKEKEIQTKASISNVEFIIKFINRYESLLDFIADKGEIKIIDLQKEFKFGYGFCLHALDLLIDNGFIVEVDKAYKWTGKKLNDIEEISINKLPYNEKDKFLSNLKEEIK